MTIASCDPSHVFVLLFFFSNHLGIGFHHHGRLQPAGFGGQFPARISELCGGDMEVGLVPGKGNLRPNDGWLKKKDHNGVLIPQKKL